MKSTFNLVFEDYDSLRTCISRITACGIAPELIVVTGSDCDALRDATAGLHSNKISPLWRALAAIGAVVGAYWGYICCAVPSTPSIAVACLAGAAMGLWVGTHIFAILRVDGVPTSEAEFIEARVENAVAVLSVSSDDSNQSAVMVRSIAPIPVLAF